MKISTRGRYSLRMMLDLATHYNYGFISLKDISNRQQISKKYLEQIVPFLNRSNLLISNRGHMGGYQLAKPPSQITVYDILKSAEGSLCPVSCMDSTPNMCPNKDTCPTLPIWEGLDKVTNEYLNSITLQNIIASYNDADYFKCFI